MRNRGVDEARRSREGGRGQAIVELAISLPLLLLLLMGAVDLGRILFAYIALEDAVHEGSLYASYTPATSAVVETRVRTSSDNAEVANAIVAATVCTTSPAPGTITVSAHYNLSLITPVGSQLFGGSIRLTATVIGTKLYQGACPI